MENTSTFTSGLNQDRDEIHRAILSRKGQFVTIETLISEDCGEIEVTRKQALAYADRYNAERVLVAAFISTPNARGCFTVTLCANNF